MKLVSDAEIVKVMQEVIDDFLIPRFIALGMNATGHWIESLEARANDGRGEIWGNDYTLYLVNGRGPGKRPPIAPLVTWVGAKFGLSGKEALSAAFAISNKIAAEGTEYYPSGTDLLEVLSSQQVTQFVYNRFGAIMNGKIEAEIKRALHQVFA